MSNIHKSSVSSLRRYRESIPAALADVLQVYLYTRKYHDYVEAAKMAAVNRDVDYNTVVSHCTMGISTTDYKVNSRRSRLLMMDDQLLMRQLIKRFPKHENCIREVIEAN
jgi:hypothetical protein